MSVSRFLRAWLRAIGGGLAFLALVAALTGAVSVLVLPALFIPQPWGAIASLVLVFGVITALVALEDL